MHFAIGTHVVAFFHTTSLYSELIVEKSVLFLGEKHANSPCRNGDPIPLWNGLEGPGASLPLVVGTYD